MTDQSTKVLTVEAQKALRYKSLSHHFSDDEIDSLFYTIDYLRAQLKQGQEYPLDDPAYRVWCMGCGKSVSSPVPKGTIMRAWVECPECIEKKHSVPPAVTSETGKEWLDRVHDKQRQVAVTSEGESSEKKCVCGHTRRQHDEEQPYPCWGGDSNQVADGCDCQSFTYPAARTELEASARRDIQEMQQYCEEVLNDPPQPTSTLPVEAIRNIIDSRAAVRGENDVIEARTQLAALVANQRIYPNAKYTAPLHELWTLAVGTDGYDKRKWDSLAGELDTLRAANQRLQARNDKQTITLLDQGGQIVILQQRVEELEKLLADQPQYVIDLELEKSGLQTRVEELQGQVLSILEIAARRIETVMEHSPKHDRELIASEIRALAKAKLAGEEK